MLAILPLLSKAIKAIKAGLLKAVSRHMPNGLKNLQGFYHKVYSGFQKPVHTALAAFRIPSINHQEFCLRTPVAFSKIMHIRVYLHRSLFL
jgi:hypothetical protein